MRHCKSLRRHCKGCVSIAINEFTFGESTGFERNIIHDDAWPFRDYVIRSLNDDKPFDRFILEHLAGDQLAPGDPAVEVGTGSGPAPVESDFGFTGTFLYTYQGAVGQTSPTGLYLTLYRAYSAELARWLSRDPIEEDGGVNLYAYVGNEPVNETDPLGLYNALGHNHILGSAFGDRLGRDDLNMLKKASADADSFKGGGQDLANSCHHAMRQPGESVEHARNAYNKFVRDQLNKAVSLENAGRHTDAIQELGYGMHAIADSFSPAHRGFQQWDGLAGIGNKFKALGHACRELYPTPSETRSAAKALQNYYGQFKNRTR